MITSAFWPIDISRHQKQPDAYVDYETIRSTPGHLLSAYVWGGFNHSFGLLNGGAKRMDVATIGSMVLKGALYLVRGK